MIHEDILRILRLILLDENAVFIHLHGIRIGDDVDPAAVGAGVLPDIHGGGKLKHRALLLLRRVKRRGKLRVAEHIHHAVIADTVAAAEILVRIVVKHAPGKAAGDVLLLCHLVQNIRMADHMLHAVLLPVEGLGGIHVTVVFADQIGLLHVGCDIRLFVAALLLSVVQEIVVGVDILQETSLLVAAHAAGLTIGIEFVCHGIGALVKRIVVHTLVDAHTPEDDGRMVSVLDDHVLHILDCLVLPVLVADVLPARHLREDQEAQLIAGRDKIVGLRIV